MEDSSLYKGLAGDRVGEPRKKMDGKEEEVVNPFARSRRLNRTPPSNRERVNSLPSRMEREALATSDPKRTPLKTGGDVMGKSGKEKATSEAEGSDKRKRESYEVQLVSSASSDEGTESPEHKKLAKEKPQPSMSLKALQKLIEELVTFGRNNSNVHKEVKRLAGELNTLTGNILREHIGDKELQLRLQEENKEARRKTKSKSTKVAIETQIMEQRRMVEKCNASTQTDNEAWKNRSDRTAVKIRQKLEKTDNVEDLAELFNQEWPAGVFKVVRELEGNPIKTDAENNLAFWKGAGAQVGRGFFKQLTERFPDLSEMTEEEKAGEEVLAWVYESRRSTSQGLRSYKTRTITSVDMGEEIQQSFKALTAWKEKLKELKVSRVALPTPETGWELQKKMMEYVLRDSEIVVMAYSAQGRKERKTQISTERGRPRLTESATSIRKRVEDEVVIVSSEKPYAEALRHIKQNVNASELGIKIKNARSTQKGAILLTVARGARGSEELKREIDKKLGNQGFTTRKGRNGVMVLHIKGLEATTSADEVKSAIREKMGSDEAEIRTGELRPAFGGTQNITVTIDREPGRRLLEMSPIQIGWATCTVKERVEVRRCLKCWGLGHTATKCNSSEDRKGLCLRCAQSGHQIKDCRNLPYCPLCNKEGHRADGIACPQFRAAVAGQRDTNKGNMPPRVAKNRVTHEQGASMTGPTQTEQEDEQGSRNRSEKSDEKRGENVNTEAISGGGADQGGPSLILSK